MVTDNLFGIVLLSASVELPKVVHEGSHAGRKVEDSVHQLAKWDLACTNKVQSIKISNTVCILLAKQCTYQAFALSVLLSRRIQVQPTPTFRSYHLCAWKKIH